MAESKDVMYLGKYKEIMSNVDFPNGIKNSFDKFISMQKPILFALSTATVRQDSLKKDILGETTNTGWLHDEPIGFVINNYLERTSDASRAQRDEVSSLLLLIDDLIEKFTILTKERDLLKQKVNVAKKEEETKTDLKRVEL